ncbi:MAG: putative membrane protein [uncultured Nocardioidaceae bacterium]|uniref:Putative membrane protein n=1 Tax=uncultured Nocardioidaceae bacterium TaxID=253824 RepID=A0A6J4L8L2_9ACTN|nr:MAG: putative membrane protein [uncultured Nocardioidaceae bacterium]
MWTVLATRAFVVVAVVEALSWVGLLAGMYAKYLTGAGDLGVRVFGPVHGGVFLAYLVLTVVVARLHRWSLGTALLGLACSVPPFATLAFEWWVVRSGRLPAVALRSAQAARAA